MTHAKKAKTSDVADAKDFTYYDEPERFRPELRFKTRFLSGDSIANWLWAYWQGRFQKSW